MITAITVAVVSSTWNKYMLPVLVTTGVNLKMMHERTYDNTD